MKISRPGNGLKPHLDGRDLLGEALASLTARPGRAVLTALGTVMGVAALVATLGLSKTAGNQIVGRFDALAATDIVVTPKAAATGRASTGAGLPWDAEARAARLNGVVAAGTLSDVDLRGDLIRSVPVNDPVAQTEFQLPVKAASPGLFGAVRAQLSTGRLPDAGHSARADRVAVVGENVAEQLHVTRIDDQPAIFLGDRLYVVIGVISDVARQSSLLGSIVIPEGTAGRDFGLGAPSSVQVETRIGAATLIAGQLPLALSPTDPTLLKVTAPPEPRRVRAGVQNDLNALFLLLGAVSLLIGAVGIANVTLVSVLERVGEIGLRRSLGAARRHIAGQFLLESTTLGLLGGILGAALGTLVVVGVAASRTWTPVLEPWVPLGAPLLGGTIGFLSGIYPSARAASMEPVEALRATM
ncbi:MAG TPA: ABC transporter permease [Acidimicrobiia bacterium]|nr:ABC transporter permease [Acidimicrobiia bacterium]